MTRATPDEVRKRYAALQSRLKSLFQRIKDDTLAPRTVVVVPALSLDPQVLATIGAARHYEERMLSMLMLLRMPRTRVVFLTSTPLAQVSLTTTCICSPGCRPLMRNRA